MNMPIINSNNLYSRCKSLPYHSALTHGFSRKEIVSDENIGLGDVSEIDSLRDPGKFVNLSKTQFPYLRNDSHRIWGTFDEITNAKYLSYSPICKLSAGKAPSLWLASVSPTPDPEMSHPRNWSSDIHWQITCPDAHCPPSIHYEAVPKPNCLPHIALSEYPSLDHLAVPTCLHTSLGREVCK